ncbi:DUF4260 family protein [Crenalkalicoccus roseus]|uniref:DUF4260 family protein n=1 Tax=Crenalkalicoccus roseus TaxID=1485588 RepID=UPI00108002D8|nr:DUF4260 family protein [Crenalkalicoccus roseus]
MNTAPAAPPVTGQPRLLLRLEGLTALAAAVTAYGLAGGCWTLFAALLLLPDLAMAGYLVGRRVGALAYNLAHSYLAPALVGGIGLVTEAEAAGSVALVWAAHIGFDRALGYGLKYPEGFTATHLGTIGTGQAASRA